MLEFRDVDSVVISSYGEMTELEDSLYNYAFNNPIRFNNKQTIAYSKNGMWPWPYPYFIKIMQKVLVV